MKYCSKCGNPMEEEMTFCQKCGTRVTEPPTAGVTVNGHDITQSDKKNVVQGQSNKPRKGMKILAVVCGTFAILYILLSIITEPSMLSMTAFFGVLALMFFALSKSPKGNPHLLGKQKGLKKSIFVVICVVFAFALTGIIAGQTEMNGTSNNSTDSTSDSTPESEDSDLQQEESNPDDTAKVFCDVEQFANITGEELIALLGEPDTISDGTCSGSFEIPCVFYEYKHNEVLGNVSFDLVNNEVVRFTSYKEGYEYTGKESALEDFGIEKGKKTAVAADTGAALRYRCPSDAVDDFWIALIEDDTFGFLQVTYEMMYYDEWYLPMDIKEASNYQYWTQENVKSLLKAPKSADFPGINDWSIIANPFYVSVQSYVDAQNSFGAEVRSKFAFIYSVGTSEVVYAVFDGEVIADNGYVPTADLVAQIVAGNTQE